MEHIVSVGMDVDTLKQLDNLRRAHPNVPSRVEVIRRLIWDGPRQGRCRDAEPGRLSQPEPADQTIRQKGRCQTWRRLLFCRIKYRNFNRLMLRRRIILDAPPCPTRNSVHSA